MELEVNSKEYWNDRFSSGDWEKNHGELQSAFFTELFVDEMPEWLRKDLEQNEWQIADYGCAEGGGTAVLARRFPSCAISGYDISEAGVEKARKQHPQCQFAVRNMYDDIEKADIIFSSNTLEHLSKPFGILRKLVEASYKYTILMLPFEDDYGIEEHINRFSAAFFPDKFGNHYLTCFKVIDCREKGTPYWLGKQVLIIYTNADYKVKTDRLLAHVYEYCTKAYVECAYLEKKKNRELTQRIDEVTAQKQVADQQLGLEKEKNREQTQRIDEVTVQKQEADQQLGLEEEKNRELMKRIDEVTAQKQEADQQLGLEKEKNRELMKRIDEVTAQKQETDQQLLDKLAVEEQLETAKRENKAIKEQLETAKKENKAVREQFEALEKEKGIVEKQIEDLSNEKRKAEESEQRLAVENRRLEKRCADRGAVIAGALCKAEYLATTRKFRLMHMLTRVRRQMLSGDAKERKLFFKWLWGRRKGTPDYDRRYNPIFDVISLLQQDKADDHLSGGEKTARVDTEEIAQSCHGQGQLFRHCQEQNDVLDQAMREPDDEEVRRLKAVLGEREYKGILIYPHIVYWEPLQTPQQLLRAFARAGWLCLFCEHPSLKDQHREEEPNLFITGEKEVLKAIGNHKAVVLITWMGSLPFVNRIPNASIWYHILDHLEIFSFYDEYYLALHKDVVNKAEVVSYVARPLKEQYQLGDTAVYLPNGVIVQDIEQSIHPGFIPEEMKPILKRKHKIVGYYGYLAEWMDYEMVRWLAEKHPDYEFVFIGKAIHDTSLIESMANVHLLGLKPYKELFDYAKLFDVATIPFVVDEKMDCVSPIKLYEYMALRKPVVSSSMPEVREYAHQTSFIFNAQNRDEFNFYLERAMEKEVADDAQAKGAELARRNSWDSRARTVQLSMNLANPNIARFSTCPDIIEFAIIDYDFRFQRPQHIARRMAQSGHRVFYINTAFISGDEVQVHETEENVYQVFLPFADKISIHCTDLSENREALFGHLDKLTHDWVIRDAVILADYPNWFYAVEHMKRKYGFKAITDYMDDYTGFLNPAEEIVRENCIKLLAGSDLVIASSDFLNEIAHKHARKVTISRNGTEYAYFHSVVEKPRKANARPVIGYYGAIAEWFNVDVVCQCAERFPECDIVLVGNVSAHRERLEKHANIRLIGEVPYTELLPWLHSFDVCLIPFDTSTDLIKATNPVKFYEYLSAGKKIVATEIPELEPYRNQFVYLENDPDRFCGKVALCLEGKDTLAEPEKMYEFARSNDWNCRAADFECAISDIHPKVSIVVLCYNQLDYTKQCVESVLHYTAYPNYELILVDNHSNDGTAEYLKQVAGKSDRIKVVLNETNRGFAGGNNDGIAVSSGEYIVLLNNDTVVTKGWLTGLMKHYACDGSVALVGPVTNSIGNEGKILVDYSDISGMPTFAHEYTSKHMGEEYPHQGILAMFCLMISREFYEKAGPLDENYGIGMFEDDDYSTAALRMGYKIVMAEDVFIHHYGTVSFKKLENEMYLNIFNKNRKYFENKWNVQWKQQTMRPGVPR